MTVVTRLRLFNHTPIDGGVNDSEIQVLTLNAEQAHVKHHSVNVYNNDEYVEFCVPDFELKEHIEYNKTHRWGRAIFIDGVCIHTGNLNPERVKAWESKIKDWPMPKIKYPRC